MNVGPSIVMINQKNWHAEYNNQVGYHSNSMASNRIGGQGFGKSPCSFAYDPA